MSPLPSVRATWAPLGQTPILRHRFGWQRVSMAGALVYEPRGHDAHLVFQLRPGAYNTPSLIEFLTQLHAQAPQRSVSLLWDGLPAHRSTRMLEWIARQGDWLRVERLPAYAPELNPVEQVWGNVKGRELANLCAESTADVAHVADTGLTRIGSDASLCLAFLRHTGLYL